MRPKISGKFYILIGFVIFFGLPWGGATESTRSSLQNGLDLRKSIQYGIENSPAFDSLKRNFEVYGLEESSAFWRNFPSLDFSATHGFQDQLRTTQNTPWASRLSLSLTESLYDNGVSLTKYEVAKLQKDQSEILYKAYRNKWCLELVTEYLTFSLNTKLLDIQQSQFKLLKKQFGLVSNYYHQGVKTRKDFLRFKTQISRSEIELVNAKKSVESSLQEIQKRLGVKSDSVGLKFLPVNLDEGKFVENPPQLNLVNHFEQESVNIQKKINELEADLTRRKYWPEWFLSANLSYETSQYMGTGVAYPNNERFGLDAFLRVNYNLWDWGIRRRDREVAAQKNIIQNNDLDQRMLELKAKLKELILRIEQLNENLKTAKELLSLETANIAFIEREYRDGKVQYLDLITGLKDLADAQIKYYSVLSDLQVANLTYLYHQGTLYDFLTK